MHFDILISGAGPAGLCLAQALSGQGLAIGIVEQQPQAAIAAPAFDGREIALTQPSADTLRRLGVWQRILQRQHRRFFFDSWWRFIGKRWQRF